MQELVWQIWPPDDCNADSQPQNILNKNQIFIIIWVIHFCTWTNMYINCLKGISNTTEQLKVCTLWWAVLVLSAGPWVSGSSWAGAHCSTGYSLSNCKLQLHLLGLKRENMRFFYYWASQKTSQRPDQRYEKNLQSKFTSFLTIVFKRLLVFLDQGTYTHNFTAITVLTRI